MAKAGEFAKSLRLIGQKIEENTDKLTRQAALMIDQAVVMATPVKTGRARANWRVGVGAPNPEVLPAPSTPGAGVQAAIAEGQQVIAGFNTEGGEGEIHISNNLPYIGRLNYGNSKQAPRYFVEQEVQRVAEQLRNANLVEGVEILAAVPPEGGE